MAIPSTAEIVIETTSEQMPSWQDSGQAPTITMNGAPFAQLPAPTFCSGYQVVVINSATDLTNPANILLNRYIELQNHRGHWSSTYPRMYSQMVNSILNAGNIEQQVILVASFGLDLRVPPTNDALELLLNRGAGAPLQRWDLTPDAGSTGKGWVAHPVSYIVVGNSGYSYDDGWETFADNGGSPAPASLSVKLHNNVPPTRPVSAATG